MIQVKVVNVGGARHEHVPDGAPIPLSEAQRAYYASAVAAARVAGAECERLARELKEAEARGDALAQAWHDYLQRELPQVQERCYQVIDGAAVQVWGCPVANGPAAPSAKPPEWVKQVLAAIEREGGTPT
jgi:hypothetical protein